MARAFGTDVDTVVKFFIFILIFVFDPMAVSLVIAYNVTINPTKIKEEKKTKNKKNNRITENKEIVMNVVDTDDKETVDNETGQIGKGGIRPSG